ncbi:MAG: 30S ribosomal protein S20 [Chloroflexota bacterium]
MANTKSAKKAARVSERRRIRNKPVRSSVKTYVSKALKLIQDGDAGAQEATAVAVRQLDRAAQKGVIHRNNAGRRKSRLMKKLNATLSSGSG